VVNGSAACRIVAVLCAMLATAAQAASGTCPAPVEQPVVTVTPMLPAPPEGHSLSYGELTTRLNHAMKPGADALGLSSSKLDAGRIATQFMLVHHGGAACYYLTSLDVSFGYSERSVEIAREVPQGSCMYAKILEHEHKHVAVDDAILRDNLSYVTAQLQDFADGIGPLRVASEVEANRQVAQMMKNPLGRILKHVWKIESAAQDQVDTEAEYARVENACRIAADPKPAAASLPPANPATHPLPHHSDK